MPTYVVTRHTAQADPPLDIYGAQVRYVVEAGEESSSSSSSSVSLPGDGAIFLRDEREFLGVVSAYEYLNLTGVPDGATGLYRTDEIVLTFRNADLAEETWTKLRSDIADLARSQALLSRLQEEETIILDGSEASSSSASETRCRIVRDAVVAYPAENPVGYRLRVRCLDCADSAVFLWRDDEPDAAGEIRSRSIAVCKPGDMEDFAVEALVGFPPLYRRDLFDVVTADVDLLQSGWDNIRLEVEHLFATQAHFAAGEVVSDAETIDETTAP